jgi:hypothetical protein
MSVEVDVETFGQIILGPGAVQTWWHIWYYTNNGASVFDSDHWYWMSVIPESDQSSVEVSEQWFDKDVSGYYRHWATFRNLNGATSVAFRPKIVQAPSKF